jgi:uncharacterized Zn finger protein
MGYYSSWGGWAPYVTVAERKRKAAKKVEQLRKQGKAVDPISLEGRTIAKTYWGKSWCENLESYSDFANRLPRGRTYVRNGSVIDLKIAAGSIEALVSGSDIYKVTIGIAALAKNKWQTIVKECSGKIDSLVELLKGKFSKSVMEIIARKEQGLFPQPSEIKINCSCPDYADVCKHVAAVFYGIGARLDINPELLFTLRQVDHNELIIADGALEELVKRDGKQLKPTFTGDELSDLFGIDVGVGATDINITKATKTKGNMKKPSLDKSTVKAKDGVKKAKQLYKVSKAEKKKTKKPQKASNPKKAEKSKKTKKKEEINSVKRSKKMAKPSKLAKSLLLKAKPKKHVKVSDISRKRRKIL